LLHEDDDDSGVVVIAQAAGPNTIDTDVQPGDIIRAINRTQLQSVSQLQVTVRQLKSSDPVVLQIERGGKLQYLGKSCASPSMICPAGFASKLMLERSASLCPKQSNQNAHK